MKKLTPVIIIVIPALIAMLLVVGVLLFVTRENTNIKQLTVEELVLKKIASDCPDTPELQQCKLWEVVQAWRVSQNKPLYKWNNGLCKWASLRNEEIKTDWSHNGFHYHLNEIWNDIHYNILGENLARGYDKLEDKMFTAWLNSPSHKANLDEAYTDSCITVSGSYAVQLFATF